MHLGGPTSSSELGALRRSKVELLGSTSMASWTVVARIVEALDQIKEVQTTRPFLAGAVGVRLSIKAPVFVSFGHHYSLSYNSIA
nr:hypothetical protein Iba_chr12aCG8270 [Ipomoea batatas]